jgi:hypothetical protein
MPKTELVSEMIFILNILQAVDSVQLNCIVINFFDIAVILIYFFI